MKGGTESVFANSIYRMFSESFQNNYLWILGKPALCHPSFLNLESKTSMNFFDILISFSGKLDESFDGKVGLHQPLKK